MCPQKNPCMLFNPGAVRYEKAYGMQKTLVQRRLLDEIPDALIIAEHEPVITAGRGFKRENLLLGEQELLLSGIKVFRIERGGDATYHGPGQLVGYPITRLSGPGRDIRRFVDSLEQTIIHTLKDFGIEGGSIKEHPGVWVKRKKIASIGIAVKKWVTYHGFALNVSPEIKNFSFINPCGLDYNVITSMEKVLGRRVPLEKVKERMLVHYARIFNLCYINAGAGEKCEEQ